MLYFVDIFVLSLLVIYQLNIKLLPFTILSFVKVSVSLVLSVRIFSDVSLEIEIWIVASVNDVVVYFAHIVTASGKTEAILYSFAQEIYFKRVQRSGRWVS